MRQCPRREFQVYGPHVNVDVAHQRRIDDKPFLGVGCVEGGRT